MKITPLDIRQRRFEKSFHGYNPKEILEFLEVVADEFEELHKESIRLREDAKDFQAQLEQHRNREKVLQEPMIGEGLSRGCGDARAEPGSPSRPPVAECSPCAAPRTRRPLPRETLESLSGCTRETISQTAFDRSLAG